MSAEIGASKICIIFRIIGNSLFQPVKAGGFGGTKFITQGSIVMTAPQGPHGIDKGQSSQFMPCGAKIPDGMLMRCMQEIDAGIANEENVLEQGGLRVVG